VLILATGFDSVTGSLNQLDIRGTGGKSIAEYWADGTKTSMGIAIPTFPVCVAWLAALFVNVRFNTVADYAKNMFYLYGAQAPTAFSNGPSCTQFQAEFVERTLKQAKAKGITKLDATQESADDWYVETEARLGLDTDTATG